MNKIIFIPGELRQFTDEVALLVIAAKQEARVFHASNGELELIEEFRISTPHFSDNEAMPQERGKQENLIEHKIHVEYLDRFAALFRLLAPRFKLDHVYLFAPTHTADELMSLMKPIFGSVAYTTINGIFTKDSPSELLKRIRK